jgi:peptidoglycan hydrolase CwlO-like protein
MNWSLWILIMKKNINTKMTSCVLATIFALTLSFSANAEDAKLEEAKAEIARLEAENASLKDELEIYEKKIAEHRAKLEEYDNMDMGMNKEE